MTVAELPINLIKHPQINCVPRLPSGAKDEPRLSLPEGGPRAEPIRGAFAYSHRRILTYNCVLFLGLQEIKGKYVLIFIPSSLRTYTGRDYSTCRLQFRDSAGSGHITLGLEDQMAARDMAFRSASRVDVYPRVELLLRRKSNQIRCSQQSQQQTSPLCDVFYATGSSSSRKRHR